MVAGPRPGPHHLRPVPRQLRRVAGRRRRGRGLEKVRNRCVVVVTYNHSQHNASLHLAQDCTTCLHQSNISAGRGFVQIFPLHSWAPALGNMAAGSINPLTGGTFDEKLIYRRVVILHFAFRLLRSCLVPYTVHLWIWSKVSNTFYARCRSESDEKSRC